jgi:hypothetical protein
MKRNEFLVLGEFGEFLLIKRKKFKQKVVKAPTTRMFVEIGAGLK